MKKFYESPVVELTGFSAEDVITTSVVNIEKIDTTGALSTEQVGKLEAAVKYNFDTNNVKVYEW